MFDALKELEKTLECFRLKTGFEHNSAAVANHGPLHQFPIQINALPCIRYHLEGSASIICQMQQLIAGVGVCRTAPTIPAVAAVGRHP